MTKKLKIETTRPTASPQKPRTLTKKEREQLEGQFNEAMNAVVDSIEAGRIQAPWWRQSD